MLKTLAYVVVAIYVVVILLVYLFQTRLIFHPGRLPEHYAFKNPNAEEVFITTEDNERINALYFHGTRDEVLLYFHGNAGDLSGWQYVAQDFTPEGYHVLVIDYRGYGKSSGTISESGFYKDAEAAFEYLVNVKAFYPRNIIVYGRSIGSGVASWLAAQHRVAGLVLESPFTSLGALANEKLPFFFPSLFLRYCFDTIKRINDVKCPIIFVHGDQDTLIPHAHAERLFKSFNGSKKLITISGGAHNDLSGFPAYQSFLRHEMRSFFSK